jgi:ankyrin repeat protein
VKLLLDKGAKVDQKLAMHAAQNGTATISEKIQSKLEPQEVNQTLGKTPLYEAVKTRNKEKVEFALEQRPSDINQQSQTMKNTPLHIASSNGDIEIVKLLIENGADVNKQNKDGTTALYIASQRGDIEIVKLLIQNGADVNKQNKDGKTALYIASKWGYPTIVKLLSDKEAKVDQKLAMHPSNKDAGMRSQTIQSKLESQDGNQNMGNTPLPHGKKKVLPVIERVKRIDIINRGASEHQNTKPHRKTANQQGTSRG